MRLLGSVLPARLTELAVDEGFLARVGEDADDPFVGHLHYDRWYQGQSCGLVTDAAQALHGLPHELIRLVWSAAWRGGDYGRSRWGGY